MVPLGPIVTSGILSLVLEIFRRPLFQLFNFVNPKIHHQPNTKAESILVKKLSKAFPISLQKSYRKEKHSPGGASLDIADSAACTNSLMQIDHSHSTYKPHRPIFHLRICCSNIQRVNCRDGFEYFTGQKGCFVGNNIFLFKQL